LVCDHILLDTRGAIGVSLLLFFEVLINHAVGDINLLGAAHPLLAASSSAALLEPLRLKVRDPAVEQPVLVLFYRWQRGQAGRGHGARPAPPLLLLVLVLVLVLLGLAMVRFGLLLSVMIFSTHFIH